MTLSIGTRLGPYEILAAIGAGGMGEVYRARDTRLDRIVAIKVLPEHVANHPELKHRFEHEAKTLARLNHPHICAVFDVGRAVVTPPSSLPPGVGGGEIDFLVMEYIEGETLAQRLMKGALPLDHSLKYGIQIADALDKAHREGIIHRDLKPGNIMLARSGAKLLDFGLAKLRPVAAAGTTMSASATPTVTVPVTREGEIMGTAPYMAPEQLEGREADARTDIFAFGATLYEMLTSHRAFEGQSQASLISAIMSNEPAPVSAVQPTSPPALDRLVRKCLAKQPAERWDTAHDLADELRWLAEVRSAAVPTSQAGRPTRIPMALATALATILVVALALWGLGPFREVAPPVVSRVLIDVQPAEYLAGPRREPAESSNRVAVAIAPDGRQIAFVGTRQGVRRLYLRALDEPVARPVEGTDGAVSPFFSPDGQWLGFWAEGQLKKAPVSGGLPISVTQTAEPVGVSWGAGDRIVYAAGAAGGLWEVSANGGEPQPLTQPRSDEGEVSHRLPHVLPGGDAVLFTVRQVDMGGWDKARIAVHSFKTGEQKVVLEGGSDARYVPTGHVVFARLGTVMAVPFDLQRLEVSGEVVPIVPGVAHAVYARSSANDTGVAQFAVAASGALLYVPGGVFPDRQLELVWVDRQGRVEPIEAPLGAYFHPRLSADDNRILLWTQGQDRIVWIYDIPRGTLHRLTFEGQSSRPIWSPDEQWIVYSSAITGRENLFRRRADGSGDSERLTVSDEWQQAASWSPDGRHVAFSATSPTSPAAGADIWILDLDMKQSRAFVQTRAAESQPAFSPDGKWLAYVSDDSGRAEVYVQAFPGPGPKMPISSDGGTEPVWGEDGTELFYRNGSRMLAVRVEAEPRFAVGRPQVLFEGPYAAAAQSNYDATRDGRRFLMLREVASAPTPPTTHLNLVLNWLEELEARVPAR